jgi:hypothetical protein
MEASKNVYALIASVMAEMSAQGISKGRANREQNYKFRGIDDVLNALSSSLSANGLVILPRVLSRTTTERQTKSGGTLFSVVLDIEFDLVSSHDGSNHTVRVQGEAMDTADKATNKAMSAAYKYMALLSFCIPTEGDNDADIATPEVVPQKQPVKVAPVVQPQSDPAIISAAQAKRLWAITTKELGLTADHLKSAIALTHKMPIDQVSSKAIQKALYDATEKELRRIATQ